jgi:hypothetical protein
MDTPTVVNIQTKEFITVKVSNKIAIFVSKIDLFVAAEITVRFLDENERTIISQILQMSGTDYSGWGDNDQYVVDWTLNQLGLSPTTQVVFGNN